jgi:hypothetical protein
MTYLAGEDAQAPQRVNVDHDVRVMLAQHRLDLVGQGWPGGPDGVPESAVVARERDGKPGKGDHAGIWAWLGRGGDDDRLVAELAQPGCHGGDGAFHPGGLVRPMRRQDERGGDRDSRAPHATSTCPGSGRHRTGTPMASSPLVREPQARRKAGDQ